MSNRRITLACTSTFLLLMTGGVAAQSEPPSSTTLTTTIRDFREHSEPGGHPDFERLPNNGYGHYAGSVEFFVGSGRKPLFSGGGYKVDSEWRDYSGRPMAPHLFNREYVAGTGENPNDTLAVLKDDRGKNAYEITWLSTTFNADGTSSWVYRVRELPGGKDLSHWNLALAPGQTVAPGTTPGYELGLDGATGFYGIKWDVPEQFISGEFTIVLNGHFFGSDLNCAVLAKGGSAPTTGAMFAPTDTPSDTGSPFNTDSMLVFNNEYNDQEGVAGPDDNGGVQSGQTFYEWFRDKPGTNMSTLVDITLDQQADGTYVFDSATDDFYSTIGGFFPIDNQLFGNSPGEPEHNYHFTAEIHAKFVYDENADQFFKFIGDDDVYVFIDGKLAIDLGGVHSATEQYADADRFGLTHGETYSLDFFFAERHRTESNFRIETNLVLENVMLPTISAAFD